MDSTSSDRLLSTPQWNATSMEYVKGDRKHAETLISTRKPDKRRCLAPISSARGCKAESRTVRTQIYLLGRYMYSSFITFFERDTTPSHALA